MSHRRLRLGVNIDHVATIRNARGCGYPDPVRAAKLAAAAGADGITAHLREDRRHITDTDIQRLCDEIDLPLNLEIAATDEMLSVALKHAPHAACIVPEKREERTTEGGLNVIGGFEHLKPFVARLSDANIRVSLFIEPNIEAIEAAKALNVPVVELHTGAYCDAPTGAKRAAILKRIKAAADHAETLGLECHAGHGLTFDTVQPIAAIANVQELNIGHFLVGEGIFVGLESSIKEMRRLMDEVARS
ncbi:MAG: pyridoxine 5'-phosphate synthase [Magnetovibrio sp.]|nr:pyridoxine 5'-phosphate synthase [Magnetovibrio sp.]